MWRCLWADLAVWACEKGWFLQTVLNVYVIYIIRFVVNVLVRHYDFKGCINVILTCSPYSSARF